MVNSKTAVLSAFNRTLTVFTLLAIPFIYGLIWYFDATRGQTYQWKVDLLPPLGIIASSLRNLLKLEGGYAISAFGLLSFISFFALSRKIGSLLNRSLYKVKGTYFTGLGTLTGLAFLAVAYTFIGMAGLIDPAIAWLLFWSGLCALAIDLAVFFKHRPGSLVSMAKEKLKSLSYYHYFLIFWTGIWSATAILIPTYHNFLQNHLGLPYFYMNERSILPNPYQILSYFPQNCEMLILHFVLLGSFVGVKLFLWGIWMLTVNLVYQFTKELSNEISAVIAACWFAVIPVIYWLLVNGKNDLMVVLYLLAGVLLLFKNLKQGPSKAVLFFSGIFIGMALGTKYTAWFFFLPIPLYLFFLLKGKNFRSCIYDLSLFTAGILITSGFWYARNFIWTGNPVYPLFASLFNTTLMKPWHEHAGSTSIASLGLFYSIKQLFVMLAGFIPDFKQLPIPSGATIMPFQWGVTLPFLLLNIAGFRYFSWSVRWLILLSSFGFVGMLYFEPAVRYYPTCVAVLCITTMTAVYYLAKDHPRWMIHLLGALVVLSIFTTTTNRQFRTRVLGSVTLLLSGLDPLTAKTKSVDYFPVSPQDLLIMGRYIDDNLPLNSRILIVGDERPPLIKRRHLIQTDQHREIIDDWWLESKTVPGLLGKISEENVTHILLNTNYFSEEVIYTGPRTVVPRELHKKALPTVTELLKKHCTVAGVTANGDLLLLSLPAQ